MLQQPLEPSPVPPHPGHLMQPLNLFPSYESGGSLGL